MAGGVMAASRVMRKMVCTSAVLPAAAVFKRPRSTRSTAGKHSMRKKTIRYALGFLKICAGRMPAISMPAMNMLAGATMAPTE